MSELKEKTIALPKMLHQLHKALCDLFDDEMIELSDEDHFHGGYTGDADTGVSFGYEVEGRELRVTLTRSELAKYDEAAS